MSKVVAAACTARPVSKKLRFCIKMIGTQQAVISASCEIEMQVNRLETHIIYDRIVHTGWRISILSKIRRNK